MLTNRWVIAIAGVFLQIALGPILIRRALNVIER